MPRRLPALLLTLLPFPALADGPGDNLPANVRPVPKRGIIISPADRKTLDDGLAALAREIDAVVAKKDPKRDALLPDVRIFHRAVHDALAHNEILAPEEVGRARELIAEGRKRAESLLAGQAPWTTQTGLVVRGYVSKIDGSVQPYGLVIADSWSPQSAPSRLDVWLHGRGETLTELNFLFDRMHNPGTVLPTAGLMLHPYGRFCNAFKFAGEVDVYEALDDVCMRYRIDDDRIGMRGFSMGGAGCWQFAVHDSSRWFAAAPGAGFAETPRFLDVFQKETLDPPWYERRLWQMYDSTDWAVNLANCPTIAYSGEKDVQKQAADVMVEACEKAGLRLRHIIGAGAGHFYTPEARAAIDNALDAIARSGRRVPARVQFTTYTLRYDRMAWVTVTGLAEHWAPGNVDARLVPKTDSTDGPTIVITTRNVTGLTLDFPPGSWPYPQGETIHLCIDGRTYRAGRPYTDGSWSEHIHKEGDAWKAGPLPDDGLRKRHGRQGPIDDAFLDAFVFVRPTGSSSNPKVRAWVDAEMKRAVTEWRRHFRGDARIVDDVKLDQALIASANVVLWGSPEDNIALRSIADSLPIKWTRDAVRVDGARSYPASNHALIAIYPNPADPRRYVVINSGFTFREYDYLNNARQTPKLPDWAVIDVDTPPDARHPGKVVDADFFGESWELKPKHAD